MKKRYIKLEEGARILLQELKKEGLTERIRDRSHALLLSDKGFDVGQVAEIFGVERKTVLGWYNRWEREGVEGLSDHSKSGRPRIFDELEEKKFY